MRFADSQICLSEIAVFFRIIETLFCDCKLKGTRNKRDEEFQTSQELSEYQIML